MPSKKLSTTIIFNETYIETNYQLNTKQIITSISCYLSKLPKKKLHIKVIIRNHVCHISPSSTDVNAKIVKLKVMIGARTLIPPLYVWVYDDFAIFSD